MFINTYYLHWEDWPTALLYPSLPPITPPSLTPPLTCDLYKRKPSRAYIHFYLQQDTLCERVRPPPSIKSNFTHKTSS